MCRDGSYGYLDWWQIHKIQGGIHGRVFVRSACLYKVSRAAGVTGPATSTMACSWGGVGGPEDLCCWHLHFYRWYLCPKSSGFCKGHIIAKWPLIETANERESILLQTNYNEGVFLLGKSRVANVQSITTVRTWTAWNGQDIQVRFASWCRQDLSGPGIGSGKGSRSGDTK